MEIRVPDELIEQRVLYSLLIKNALHTRRRLDSLLSGIRGDLDRVHAYLSEGRFSLISYELYAGYSDAPDDSSLGFMQGGFDLTAGEVETRHSLRDFKEKYIRVLDKIGQRTQEGRAIDIFVNVEGCLDHISRDVEAFDPIRCLRGR